METSKLYFSDGKSLTIKEGDLIVPIKLPSNIDDKSKEIQPFFDMPFEAWYHTSYGLGPSIIQGLINSVYFCLVGKTDILYNTNSITRIESD